MKKKVDDYIDLGNRNFNLEPLANAVDTLIQIQNELTVDQEQSASIYISLDYWSGEGRMKVLFKRDETDEEYENRLEQEDKDTKKAKKEREKQKQRDLEELARLKAIYETGD